MYRQLLISVLINFVAAEVSLSKHGNDNHNNAVAGGDKNTGVMKSAHNSWHQHSWKPRKGSTKNFTYIDKAENMIRLPILNKYFEEKTRRKTLKKSPKRTIQKIIKKNRSKVKKLYIMKMTSYPTAMPKDEFEQDELSRKEETTTHSNQKKKSRRWGGKVARYPVPFHQMQLRKVSYKRDKRAARDLFILKDLDEMQFLKQNKDFNIVKTHFKKYW